MTCEGRRGAHQAHSSASRAWRGLKSDTPGSAGWQQPYAGTCKKHAAHQRAWHAHLLRAAGCARAWGKSHVINPRCGRADGGGGHRVKRWRRAGGVHEVKGVGRKRLGHPGARAARLRHVCAVPAEARGRAVHRPPHADLGHHHCPGVEHAAGAGGVVDQEAAGQAGARGQSVRQPRVARERHAAAAIKHGKHLLHGHGGKRARVGHADGALQ